METPDVRRLRSALALACRNTHTGNRPFGALITYGEHVVSAGLNRALTDVDPTAHAEMVAIRRAARRLGRTDLRDCTLYTSCEPCLMCAGAITWSKIERVYFVATREVALRHGFDDRGDPSVLRAYLARAGVRSIPMLTEDADGPFVAWERRVTSASGPKAS